MKFQILLILFILSCTHVDAQEIDPASSLVNFEISNFGIKTVKGSVSNLYGTAVFDPSSLELCNFDVCIDPSTIDTGSEKRDEHLRTADYFDVENHPTICFYSQNAIKVSEGYAITGTLSIKGVEKIETITFNYSDNTFKGNLEVNRTDYGIGSEGGFMIGSTALINIVAKVR